MAHSEQFTPPGAAPADTGGATAVRGTGEVLARMRALAADGAAADGVAVFNRVYLSATLSVTEAAGRRRGGGPAQVPALHVRLAERYLAAVSAAASGHRPPACWRPLLRYRRHPGVLPLQFALAGINAHTGYDLGLAVLDGCAALGCAPEDLEDEFDRAGELLAALEERIRDEVMPGPDRLQVVDPLTHLVGCWNLERSLDDAWSAARALWALRHQPELARDFAGRLDAAVGVVGRLLLTPLPLPRRAPHLPFTAQDGRQADPP